MGPLDELISNEFIPSLFGGQISLVYKIPYRRAPRLAYRLSASREQRYLAYKNFSLPVKYGGMGISILTELARKE